MNGWELLHEPANFVNLPAFYGIYYVLTQNILTDNTRESFLSAITAVAIVQQSIPLHYIATLYLANAAWYLHQNSSGPGIRHGVCNLIHQEHALSAIQASLTPLVVATSLSVSKSQTMPLLALIGFQYLATLSKMWLVLSKPLVSLSSALIVYLALKDAAMTLALSGSRLGSFLALTSGAVEVLLAYVQNETELPGFCNKVQVPAIIFMVLLCLTPSHQNAVVWMSLLTPLAVMLTNAMEHITDNQHATETTQYQLVFNHH